MRNPLASRLEVPVTRSANGHALVLQDCYSTIHPWLPWWYDTTDWIGTYTMNSPRDYNVNDSQYFPRRPFGNYYWYWDGQRWHQMPASQMQPAVAQPRSYTNKGVSGVEHLLHAVLTLGTCGIWFPIWIVRTVLGGRSRSVARY